MDYPYNLGSYTQKVTTSLADAQRWFDRGLNRCFGYHHEEAVGCFEKAVAVDSNCAMAHWGIAYALGPNYNFPWELQDPAGKAAALARAHDFSRAALALIGRLTAPEHALIEALPTVIHSATPSTTNAPGTTPLPPPCGSRTGRIPTTSIYVLSSQKRSSTVRPGIYVGPEDRRARARRRHARGARGARIRLPRPAQGDEPSRPFAHD